MAVFFRGLRDDGTLGLRDFGTSGYCWRCPHFFCCLVVSWSRRLVVPWSCSPAVSSSCWRAPLSHSQSAYLSCATYRNATPYLYYIYNKRLSAKTDSLHAMRVIAITYSPSEPSTLQDLRCRQEWSSQPKR